MDSKIYSNENISISSLLDVYRKESISMFSVADDPNIVENFAINEYNVPVRVHLHTSKEFISLVFSYESSDSLDTHEKLNIINSINENCLLTRGYLNEDKSVFIQTDICLLGGVSQNHIVSVTKLFCMTISNVFNDESTGLLFA